MAEKIMVKDGIGGGYGEIYDWDDDDEGDDELRADEVRERMGKEYHDKGKTRIKAEIPYKSGRIHGVLKTYYKTGRVESETGYKNGKADGIQREYYEDGMLKSETVYEKGKKNGSERKYNKEGALISEIHWKNDALGGFFLLCTYGSLLYRHQYAGEETVYHYIDLITHYKKGRLDGMKERYHRGMLSQRSIYKKGRRLRLTSYEDGMKHGKEIWRDKSGHPIRVVVYEKGEIIRIKGKDASGLGPEYDYNSYSNGKYKSGLSFKNGVYLTHYPYYERSFDSAGTGGELRSEISLKHGLAEGLSKEYYQKHKRAQTATHYRGGVKDGTERNFYPNGSLCSEISFRDGEKDGIEKRYPKGVFPLCALKALVRGGQEPSGEELCFHRGIQTGLTEAALYSSEPFEDADYGEDNEKNDD
jgi:antitoxin component YwqK of YwqJK toxin-antitoxin module